MDSLLKLLPVMIRLSGDQEEVREQASFAAWRATTGEQMAHSARPFRLYRTTLVVAVADETWKKQLESMSRLLLFKINALLGQKVVTFIEFRVDSAHVAAGQKPSRELPTIDLGSEPELEAAAAGIKDDELRELFLRVAKLSVIRNKG